MWGLETEHQGYTRCRLRGGSEPRQGGGHGVLSETEGEGTGWVCVCVCVCIMCVGAGGGDILSSSLMEGWLGFI